ncbi:DUF6130 family protein [Bacillus xiapuensis]|uniref:DUF6130 family protein n=1 Tax=Bacillus xiapuensis TaxID=2014075 RepID=UPI000C23BD05|nr:DUF6130 family protein [Bacillus xiapuensis]
MKAWLMIMAIGLAGCKQYYPEPEALKPVPSLTEAEAQAQNRPSNHWTVRHLLKGNQLFIECVVNGVSFANHRSDGTVKGRAVVYIDDKFYKNYHTAAFIVKGLTPGKHKVHIQLTDAHNRPLGFEKTFFITIP